MSEQQDEPAKKPRLNLTTSQVAASALAACSASIVASYLGVAGTVIGAAVGSVVATTGAAIWGHLFRRGGDRIKQTLLVNGQPVQVMVDRVDTDAEAAPEADADADAAESTRVVNAPARLGRFYGAGAAPAARRLWTPEEAGGTRTTAFVANGRSAAGSARTTVAGAHTAADPTGPRTGTATSDGTAAANDSNDSGHSGGSSATTASSDSAGSARAITAIRRYRKPIGVVMAIVAVFCVSISVGFLAGGPVRNAGSNTAPPAGGTTTTSTVQRTQGRDPQSRASAGETSGSASAGTSGSASASASGTPSSSGGASPSDSPTPTASPSAGSAGTGTAGLAPAGAATAGATNTSTKTP
jgi:hypothetical protein